jgi:Rps23 Pro-64 3,4-dihydroxylase Tpa1-like proline 4-hydroxylase
MIHTVHNFLEPEILAAILKKFEDAKGTASFEVNDMGRWGKGLESGSYAPVLILPLDEYKDYFIQKYKSVNPIFEPYNKLTCFMHVWPRGSQINFHHDQVNNGDRLSSTIYLNEQWNWNWGGLFLYDDAHLGQGWVFPHSNKMIWFVPPIYHATSMVSLLAEYPRLSIQLFFEK